MVARIKDHMQDRFPDYRFTVLSDEEKGTVSISAEKDLASGFTIHIGQNTESVAVSFFSRIRSSTVYFGSGLTLLLTLVFGNKMLHDFGLVSGSGGFSLMRVLLYIIPVLVFIIPSFIGSKVLASLINPVDSMLVEMVKSELRTLGISPLAD